MQTKLLSSSDWEEALSALKRGEPVAFPTETVYGLGAPLFNEKAVQRLFEIKGRPVDNPLIAHIASLKEADRLSDRLGGAFDLLAKRFWPGPLTIVVQRKESVPALVSAGQPSIAIRMPAHPIARRLIEELGEPLAAPSANLSGRPSPTRAEDVLEDLEGKIPFVIDGGECAVGLESTVISLFHERPTLLRPGQISRAALEEVLEVEVGTPSASQPILSPGMKYRHYAPKAPIRLVFERQSLSGPFLHPTAKSLYADLRRADRLDPPEILIYCDAEMQKEEALMNRLLRAAGIMSYT